MLVEVPVGVDSSDSATAVPIRLSPVRLAVAPIRSCRAHAGELAGQLFDEQAKGRIPLQAVFDEPAGINAGRMLPAKVRADEGEGGVGQPAAQMHRHLTAERRVLVACPRPEVLGRQVKSMRDQRADNVEPAGGLNAL